MRTLRIAIRADAGPTIGFGHVMRCITLGTALVQRGHEVTLATTSPVPSLQERCDRFGIDTVPLDPTGDDATALRALQPDLVIVDGYHLGEVAASLHDNGLLWMAVDDNRELPLREAAAVLNHNLFANRELYPELTAGRVWTGSQYALLRGDLTALSCRDTQPESAQNVLLSMGGADPLELSKGLALGIAEKPGTIVRVASNTGRSTHQELESLVAKHNAIEFATPDLIASFDLSDIAVIGAGTTLWETAYLGIPTIALITAENQQDGALSAGQAGIATVLDAREAAPDEIIAAVRGLAADRATRENMMTRGRQLFDGEGPGRVARNIEALVAENA